MVSQIVLFVLGPVLKDRKTNSTMGGTVSKSWLQHLLNAIGLSIPLKLQSHFRDAPGKELSIVVGTLPARHPIVLFTPSLISPRLSLILYTRCFGLQPPRMLPYLYRFA
jgi:hypothetical protein